MPIWTFLLRGSRNRAHGRHKARSKGQHHEKPNLGPTQMERFAKFNKLAKSISPRFYESIFLSKSSARISSKDQKNDLQHLINWRRSWLQRGTSTEEWKARNERIEGGWQEGSNEVSTSSHCLYKKYAEKATPKAARRPNDRCSCNQYSQDFAIPRFSTQRAHIQQAQQVHTNKPSKPCSNRGQVYKQARLA